MAGLAINVRTPALELLACPRCGGALTGHEDSVTCSECGGSWPRRDGYIDFLTDDTPVRLGSGWRERQEEVVGWYAQFHSTQSNLISCLQNDYESVAEMLASASGRVLDLGGGMGVTRDYLPDGVEYVTLDPSVEWLSPSWDEIGRRFPSLTEEMAFVRGVGESLPFRDAAFDTVISLCALNHASRADRTLAEAARALRPGGRLMLALEDMEPPWRDLPRLPGRRPRTTLKKLAATTRLRSWPVQSDHTAISESEIATWAADSLRIAAPRVGRRRRPRTVPALCTGAASYEVRASSRLDW